MKPTYNYQRGVCLQAYHCISCNVYSDVENISSFKFHLSHTQHISTLRSKMLLGTFVPFLEHLQLCLWLPHTWQILRGRRQTKQLLTAPFLICLVLKGGGEDTEPAVTLRKDICCRRFTANLCICVYVSVHDWDSHPPLPQHRFMLSCHLPENTDTRWV